MARHIKMAKGKALDLTDYENYLLTRFDSRGGVPQSLERLTNKKWVAHVRADLPKSDFTWEQYEAHVKAFFGDGCFLTKITHWTTFSSIVNDRTDDRRFGGPSESI